MLRGTQATASELRQQQQQHDVVNRFTNKDARVIGGCSLQDVCQDSYRDTVLGSKCPEPVQRLNKETLVATPSFL